MANRQAYLRAMGIPVWVSREPTEAAAGTAESATPAAAETPAVDGLDWRQLAEQVVACQRCSLHSSRTQTVFGVGHQQAKLMLIGEAPGAEEDKRGEPFVGAAGQLLNAMLQAIGIARQDVYIANILKCRPPGNRDPQADEVAMCSGYLARQIQLVQPRLIVALGRIAAQNLLHTSEALARLRGKLHDLPNCAAPLLVTYHPAYLLRTPADKAKAWQDLKRIHSCLYG